MTKFKVLFVDGRSDVFEFNKTTTELKGIIDAALQAQEVIKVGERLIFPQNIKEVEKIV